MTNFTEIAKEFDSLIPVIRADYEHYVRATIERIAAEHGPTGPRNYHDYDMRAWREVSQYVRRHWKETGEPVSTYSGRTDLDKMEARIAEARLADHAQEYAENTVAKFVTKLTAKLGHLDQAELVRARADSLEFSIRGTRDGRKIFVEQSCIFKVSSNGKPFNQWPARIYVDGKFTPEKAFKAQFKNA